MTKARNRAKRRNEMKTPIFRELMTRYPANASEERRQLILLSAALVGLALALMASLFA